MAEKNFKKKTRELFAFAKYLVLVLMGFLMMGMGGGQGGMPGCGGGAGAEGGKGGSAFGMLIPLVLMFAIFYFLLIRPQQKRTKAHKELLGRVKRGDRVVTSGGLHGRITGLDDQVVVLEISEKVRVKVNRSAISGVVSASAAPAPKADDKKDDKANDKKKDKK